MTDEHRHHTDDESETDRMSVNLPIGGGFYVSGPNASKMWNKVGWALIILASGFALERIANVFQKISQ